MQKDLPRIGPCLMTGLKGPEISEEERAFFLSCRPAGVILFQRNILSFKQTHALCREIKALYPSREPPPLMAVDLEGGAVNRFSRVKGAFPWPSPEETGRLKPRGIFSLAKIMGRRLRALGIDINFAPVVDIPRKASAVLKGRVFHRDPEILIPRARAFIDGLLKEGVLPCLKHFPGHGGVRGDSHKTLPRDGGALKDLSLPLRPFRELKHCPLIMTAHIEFKNIDPGPATFSRKILGGILRRKLRFQGVIVSDDMNMGALAGFRPEERFFKALTGGCDLVLFRQKPKTPGETGRFFARGREAFPPSEAENLPSPAGRLKSAQTRVNRLRKSRKGLPSASWAEAHRVLSSPGDHKRFKKLTAGILPAD